MYVVTKTHDFNSETEASLFDKYEDAVKYLRWYWNEYLKIEIESESDLDTDRCYVSDDGEYGQVEWTDECKTMFHLIEISDHRESYVSRFMS